MKQYLDLLRDVKENGTKKGDRTGTGTTSVFGRQLRFDLKNSFPLMTTKKVNLKNIFVELDWFLKGDTNIKYLTDNGCNIWNEWALTEEQVIKENEIYWEEYGYPSVFKVGDLGPVYGKQWRSWKCGLGRETVDQISEVINLLKTKPDSRRIIVNAWNIADLPNESISPQENVLNGKMALPPCHLLFQFYTSELTLDDRLNYFRKNNFDIYLDSVAANEILDVALWLDEKGVPKRKLDCQLYIRSNDLFLGAPYNIASYALLTYMIAHVCNMIPNEFIQTIGDAHLYSNHMEQVDIQLKREPKVLPTLKIKRKVESIFDFKWEDFELENYNPDAFIKAPIAV